MCGSYHDVVSFPHHGGHQPVREFIGTTMHLNLSLGMLLSRWGGCSCTQKPGLLRVHLRHRLAFEWAPGSHGLVPRLSDAALWVGERARTSGRTGRIRSPTPSRRGMESELLLLLLPSQVVHTPNEKGEPLSAQTAEISSKKLVR